MTEQETKWKNHKVFIYSLLSKSGKIHLKHRKYVGRVGTVLNEAKNNMLLVKINNKHSQKFISIPAGCLIDLG